MAHLNNIKQEYTDLRKRLDKYPVGAPESKHLYEILRLLFSEEQARLASNMPMAPATAGKISRRTGMKENSVIDMLDTMADRGLVMDFTHARSGKTYYMLAPTVIGFFEFSLMRERSDIPQKALSEAMYHYLYDNSDYAREVFQQETQLGRALVHETALFEEDLSEVVDWERATQIIEGSDRHGVSLCYCRHKARHLGHACGKPEEICLSVSTGAEWLVSRNLAREISKEEMLDLLELGREEGLVHITDNVAKDPAFICNCCGCCCGMLGAINKHGITNAVHASGFIAAVDTKECISCGKCAKRCPIDAITIREEKRDGKKVKWAEVDEDICLGCGVCERACNKEALWMKKRKERKTITPESTLERLLTMAVERGKLEHFIFDAMEEPSFDFLKRFAGAVLRMPASKKLLLNQTVKSRFIEFITNRAGI